jgi:hypothetical protein
VLVTGGCVSPAAAHRADAERVGARFRALLSVGECSGRAVSIPVRAVCEASQCAARPLDHPEWRTCRRDRDCTAEYRGCERWEAIRTASVAAARAEWPQDVCPSIVPEMPVAHCTYATCALDWVGGD